MTRIESVNPFSWALGFTVLFESSFTVYDLILNFRYISIHILYLVLIPFLSMCTHTHCTSAFLTCGECRIMWDRLKNRKNEKTVQPPRSSNVARPKKCWYPNDRNLLISLSFDKFTSQMDMRRSERVALHWRPTVSNLRDGAAWLAGLDLKIGFCIEIDLLYPLSKWLYLLSKWWRIFVQ